MIHKVRLWPQFYEATLARDKMFEVRVNDRGYQKCDTIVLQEFDPEKIIEQSDGKGFEKGAYTGREMIFTISYVMPINGEQVVLNLKE